MLEIRVRKTVCAALLSLLLAWGSLAVAETRYVNFDIETSQLDRALITLGKQANYPIVFSSDLTRSRSCSPIVGRYTVAQALTLLLQQSNAHDDKALRYELVDNSFIVIVESAEETVSISHEEFNIDPTSNVEHLLVYGKQMTGSRLRRSDFTGSNPVDVLESSSLHLKGSPSVSEKLKFLPAVVGKPTNTAVTNGGDGTASVTLRGLPANNTLVLINGRRVANNGIEGDTVDLNTISEISVERIEVLKDGASAVYGADAIAGVVNIITRQSYDGFQASQYYGQAEQGDLQTLTTELLWGKEFDRGAVVVSASYLNQDDIMSRDRSVSRSADGRAWGGDDFRSSATPAARIKVNDEVLALARNSAGNYPDGSSASQYRPANDEDYYNYRQQTTAYVPREHDSVYSYMSFDISDDVTVYGSASYDSTINQQYLAATPVFSKFEALPLVVAADNPFNPFGVEVTDFRRRFVELGPRQRTDESTAKRFSMGAKGFYNRWQWDGYFGWSRSDAQTEETNVINTRRLQQSLGSDCVYPCVALNPFAAPGGLSSAQTDYIVATSAIDGYSELYNTAFTLTGSPLTLPAGTLDVALGAEYRMEGNHKTPDNLSSNGLIIGGTNFVGVSAERDVTEYFAESHIPLLKNQWGIDSFSIELAVRHSSYSDVGSTTTPKIGAMLRLTPSWLIRSTYSEGFRAPSLVELNKVAGQSYSQLDDPCANPANVGVLTGCDQLSDGSRNQFSTVFVGNQDLQPETSVSNTFGIVFTPDYFPGLQMSLDYYRIKQQNVVDANAQYIVNANAYSGDYNDLVERDENGDIERVIAKNINIGSRDLSGFDFSGRYSIEFDNRWRLTTNVMAAFIDSYSREVYVGNDTEDIAGSFVDDASDGLGALPEWKGTAGVELNRKPWRLGYSLQYIDSMTEEIASTGESRTISSWLTQDVQLGYQIDFLSGLYLDAGIDNILDEKPPLIATAFNDNIDARTHDLIGRYYYFKVTQKF
ncbi:TonB-dependent receptor [Sinobacterium norvegicum]|uniref:TonB-dependent receptor n=1 Tax=Sinobacterium norvegicum TaxID=1641715 RepID=UPI001F1F0443|nr:TonB-dependent receptor [Sinobacterium norvegicum]